MKRLRPGEVLISTWRLLVPDTVRCLEQFPSVLEAIEQLQRDQDILLRRNRAANHALQAIATHENGNPEVELRDLRLIARTALQAMEGIR